MNRILIGATVAIAFFVLAGHAQEKKTPPEQIHKLEAILGTFEGEATMMDGGKSMKGNVRHIVRKDAWRNLGFLHLFATGGFCSE